jgi:23S rRNA pseudouridine2605 synthase
LKFEDLKNQQRACSWRTRVFVEDVSYIEGEAKSEIGLKIRSSNVK